MWDPPVPELEPVSPALAGGFLTTAPPGKSLSSQILMTSFNTFIFSLSIYPMPFMCEILEVPRWIKTLPGLPCWRSGWESACQCREHGFEPWSGKIPHAAEQLDLWATTTEPARLEPVLRNKRGRDSERSAHRDEEWPPLAATRESPRTGTKTQHSQK